MTRTALLQLLDHPTAIAPAEVQELEQLARAFPYCQTAHLLLAKAAHDQGTMLASQRLRRAATYAADRILLRQLIEQTVEELETEPIEPQQVAETVGAEQAALLAPQPELVEAPPLATEPAVLAATAAPVSFVAIPASGASSAEFLTELEAPSLLGETLAATLAAAEPIVSKIQKFNINQPAALVADYPEARKDEALPETVAPAEAPLAEAPAEEPVSAPEPEPIASEPVVAAPNTETSPEPVVIAAEEIEASLIEADMEAEPEPVLAESAAPALITPASAPETPEPEIPAAAPPIRPPEEVGSARFEFGLQDEPKPAAPLYELPLVDEWASAATPLALAGADDLTFQPLAPATEPVVPQWTEAAFTGDATLGYALDEGSRLGFGLGLLTEALLAKIEAEHESTLAHEIVAAPRPAPLPPTEAFFEPDVLLLEHWATHRPVVPPTPSSSELINSFLRRQPRLTRPAMLPPSPTAQADLSVKSTRPEPELASEGLARILARQGKIDRAVEIYQRLMVKQPEKMAYFAAQIQQLQPSA
jgi:hypothetical protein